MLQLQILSGKSAGVLWDTRRFPVRIGRAANSDLRLEDDGVWEEHFQLALSPPEGFVLTAQPGALVNVNGVAAQTLRLRNGDLITAGSVKLCFRLSETRQPSLRAREWLVWSLIAMLGLGELALMVWLLQ